MCVNVYVCSFLTIGLITNSNDDFITDACQKCAITITMLNNQNDVTLMEFKQMFEDFFQNRKIYASIKGL